MQFTTLDFDELCWHDCHIWGMSFGPGNPENGDWTSDLILDIDFICGWGCASEAGRFKVAPAYLTFHDVEAPQIAIDWGAPSLIHPLSIAEIRREEAGLNGLRPGTPRYQWNVVLNWPEGGEIAFLASGFTQTLRTEPLFLDEQLFESMARRKLLGN